MFFRSMGNVFSVCLRLCFFAVIVRVLYQPSRHPQVGLQVAALNKSSMKVYTSHLTTTLNDIRAFSARPGAQTSLTHGTHLTKTFFPP